MPQGLTRERILGLAGTAGLLLVAVLILVMVGGGGGGGDEEQAAAPATGQEEPEADPTPPPLTDEQREERDEAAEVLREQGYEPRRRRSWRADHTLRVLFGEPVDGPEGTLRAFFFVDGENVGTDASSASADVRVARERDDQVTLRYRLFAPGDTEEPTGEVRRVRFRWGDGALEVRDEVPTSTERRPPGAP
jgi:hypothetical protein